MPDRTRPFRSSLRPGTGPRHGLAAVLTLLVAAALLCGCEEDVNPFIGTELPFTVWGYVNPKADTHAIRVFSIDDRLRLISPEPLDAVVTTTRLADGRRTVWRDSVVQQFNGDYRHIFWTTEPVDYGESYRLDVVRSDGESSTSSDVRVPDPIAIEILEPNENAVANIELPILIAGTPPALPRIEVLYNTFSVNGQGVTIVEVPIRINYSGQVLRRDNGWLLNVALREDFREIARIYAENELPGQIICTDALVLQVHVANEEWVSPIGVFDENVLVEPGTLTNIQNGFGFFGAGYVEEISWLPSELLFVRAGFADCAGFRN